MAETDMSKLYENLPDNSHKSRVEKKPVENTNLPEKRAEKVVRGKVKTKTNNARKFTDIFISEDAANVKNYIIMDVIVPSIKKALYDLIVGTLDMSLYGGRGNGGKRPTADKISYRDYNNVSRRDERSYGSTRTASGYSYDDIVVETRGEAESVLTRMDEIMEEYEQVRVADLYDLVGISGDYTDNKYGWTNIRNARVVRTRDGYKIEMPRAIALK
jgi:hypothetical protein